MTTELQEELFNAGVNGTIDVINIIVTSWGFGALVLMTFIALRILSKKSRRRSRDALIICCIMMLLCLTASFLYFSVFILLGLSPAIGKITDEAAIVQEANWNRLSDVAQTLPVLIGDSIVVWRAWVFLPERSIWKVFLTVAMMANIGLNIADMAEDNIEGQKSLQGVLLPLDWISVIASLTINLFVTIFIAWKWRGHQQSWAAVSPGRGNTSVHKILLLLIESGAIFCAAQCLYIFFFMFLKYAPSNLDSNGLLYSFHFVVSLFAVATALYPAAVIILVNTNNSPIAESIHFEEMTQPGSMNANSNVATSTG
ncbi:hypothetical protein GYMLUDRAFT_245846 [Collybiopsis luxurians FD-317 M1]|uniref:Unplaced genomic scaffold GYMLUscaffold_35, whole genome shotgun sequence n=1 Tax=Collybiopsis luxurians FD-317 M1 TaxID=944289 RepID=A0A0D0C8C8_9AGAR|nr:hypothetical protein GYMLUDRAFT_245846 [Collybiopsis luxurians FD-317 M1]